MGRPWAAGTEDQQAYGEEDGFYQKGADTEYRPALCTVHGPRPGNSGAWSVPENGVTGQGGAGGTLTVLHLLVCEAAADGLYCTFILRGLGMPCMSLLRCREGAQWLVLWGCRLGHCAGRGLG